MTDDKLTHAEDTARRIEVVMLPIYSEANAVYDGAMVPRAKVYRDLEEIVKWLRATNDLDELQANLADCHKLMRHIAKYQWPMPGTTRQDMMDLLQRQGVEIGQRKT